MELKQLRNALDAQGYVFDEGFLITLFVATSLGRPLLIEGSAGVGKTEVAKVLAGALNTELVRLQCYEGLDESKALYEWNYQKQLLALQARKEGDCDTEGLFSEDYLLERPLLKSIRAKKPVVLLIDEIDKSDEEFEAFLLEILSDFQVSLPELGTIKATSMPVVVLTSNNTRPLSEALKRRCVYMYIDYPSIEKETRIIKAKVPHADDMLASDVAVAVNYLRSQENLLKKPSIAESLDWINALTTLGAERLDSDDAMSTLGFVLKNREDIEEIRNDPKFSGILRAKHR